MTATLVTTQLDAAIAMLSGVVKGAEIEPAVDADSRVKLRALARKQRDLLEPTPAMQQSAVRFAKARLEASLRSGRVCTAAELFDAIAQGVRAHVLLLSREGGMGRFRALTAQYAERKRRKYGSAPITQATKALYKQLASVRWVARRK